MKQATHLEPAERNPKAIRRTVIFLILIILIGGGVIVWKYKQKLDDEAAEFAKGRPVKSEKKIDKNFQMLMQDGEVKDLTVMEGKLTLMTTFSVNHPVQSRKLIEVMKAAEKEFPNEDRLQFLLFSADHPDVASVEQINAFAKEMGAVGKNWYFFTAHDDGYVGYLKNKLRLGIVRGKGDKVSGKELPDLLKIVDPALQLRGQVHEFRFLNYHQIQDEALEKLKSDPSLKDDEKVVRDSKLVAEWQNYMHKNLKYVLENEEFDVSKIKEVNRSNRYSVPLMIFGGFILFIIVLGLKVRRQRAAA